MRGIVALVCALSLSAASGCCGWCGGCGSCGSGGYPTAAAPSYDSGATYAGTDSGMPTDGLAEADQIPSSAGSSSAAPASYDAPASQPSVEMEEDLPSDRTVRRNVSSRLD
ncbi:MAG: hypothetical protein AB7U73_22375 [Pirellulales bacterium]